jgi:uncharacterized protein YigE (DUF2233 family)
MSATTKALGFGLGALIVFIAGRELFDLATEGQLEIKNLARSETTRGIEVVRADLYRSFRKTGRLIAVYAQPDRVQLAIMLNDRQLPIRALANDALLLVNGSYFTPEHQPTGLLVSQGHQLSKLRRKGGGAGTGIFVLHDGHASLYPRETIKKVDYETSAFAIQAGPRVIEPGGVGGIMSDDGLRANRTVIGSDRRGRIVLAVTYGEDGGSRTGATLYELMHLFSEHGIGAIADDLTLDSALNLDGGPSTGLFLRDPEIDLPEGARVYSVLALRAAGSGNERTNDETTKRPQ